jgi:hypothetical protein
LKNKLNGYPAIDWHALCGLDSEAFPLKGGGGGLLNLVRGLPLALDDAAGFRPTNDGARSGLAFVGESSAPRDVKSAPLGEPPGEPSDNSSSDTGGFA